MPPKKRSSSSKKNKSSEKIIPEEPITTRTTCSKSKKQQQNEIDQADIKRSRSGTSKRSSRIEEKMISEKSPAKDDLVNDFNQKGSSIRRSARKEFKKDDQNNKRNSKLKQSGKANSNEILEEIKSSISPRRDELPQETFNKGPYHASSFKRTYAFKTAKFFSSDPKPQSLIICKNFYILSAEFGDFQTNNEYFTQKSKTWKRRISKLLKIKIINSSYLYNYRILLHHAKSLKHFEWVSGSQNANMKFSQLVRNYLPQKLESITMDDHSSEKTSWGLELIRALVKKGQFKSLKLKNLEERKIRYFQFGIQIQQHQEKKKKKPKKYGLEDFIFRLNKIEELSLLSFPILIQSGKKLAKQLEQHKFLNTLNISSINEEDPENELGAFLETYTSTQKIKSLNFQVKAQRICQTYPAPTEYDRNTIEKYARQSIKFWRNLGSFITRFNLTQLTLSICKQTMRSSELASLFKGISTQKESLKFLELQIYSIKEQKNARKQETLTTLADCLNELSNLQTLNISQFQNSFHDLSILFSPMKKLKTLRSLSLLFFNNHSSKDELQSICDFISQQERLQSLSLVLNTLTNTKLVSYYKSHNFLFPAQIEMIAKAIQGLCNKSKLKTLNLRFGKCQYFKPIPEHCILSNMLLQNVLKSSLNHLSLIFEGKYLTDYEAPKLFRALSALKNLKSLCLVADIDKLDEENLEKFTDLMESQENLVNLKMEILTSKISTRKETGGKIQQINEKRLYRF